LHVVVCGAVRGACGQHAGKRGPKAVNAQEAADILGVSRRRDGDLLEMLRALTLSAWLNTAEPEKRRVAVRGLLTHWQDNQDEMPRRREAHPTSARPANVRRRPR